MRILSVLLVSAFALNLVGQEPPRRPASNYDATKETKFEGTVSEVIHAQSRGRQAGGVHILLNTGGGVTEIHLGPNTYLSSNGINLIKGSKISVVGCKSGTEGKEFVIAREIQMDGKSLSLRDKTGIPVWSRGRR